MEPQNSAGQPNVELPKTSLGTGVTTHLPAFGQAIAFFSVLAYVLGYVIVNTYLGQFGVSSKSPFSLQYVSSGLTLLLLLVFFVVTTGIKVFRMDGDGRIIFQRRPQWIGTAIWWIVTLACLLASIGSSILFSAAATTMVLLSQSSKTVVAALGAFVAIDFQLVFWGVYRRFPIFGILFSGALLAAIFWFASRHGDMKDFISIAGYFLALAIGCLMALEFDRMFHSTSTTRIVVGLLMLFLIAVGYANGIYQRIPQGMGGGKPVRVQLLIAGQSLATIQQVIPIRSQLSDGMQLLAEDSEELVLLVPSSNGTGHPVRLSKRLIDGIVPTAEPTPSKP